MQFVADYYASFLHSSPLLVQSDSFVVVVEVLDKFLVESLEVGDHHEQVVEGVEYVLVLGHTQRYL